MKKIYLLLSAALLLNIGAFGQNVNALFNKISNDVMNKDAPDERDKTYDVSLIEKDGKSVRFADPVFGLWMLR